MLPVSHFTVRSGRVPADFDGYTIVQLTDLHGRWFGPGNAELIETVRAAAPRLIVMTGDMINCLGDDGGSALAVCRAFVGEVPLYFVGGNHELVGLRRRPGDILRFLRQMSALGVVRLGSGRRTIACGSGRIAVCGLELPLPYYLPIFDRRSRGTLSVAEMTRRAGPAPEDFTVLLTHAPYFFPTFAGWGADLIFAGHLHGGMVRLPLVGGVFSPDWTLFPKYDAGQFVHPRGGGGQSAMIVGRGLGSNHRPRIHNPPEVVVVTLRRA